MDKNEMRKVAADALREMQYSNWSVSTVWQKQAQTEPHASQLSTKRVVTWLIDFTNDEGTFPRIFFLFDEKAGKDSAKEEIKRQLKELKERVTYQQPLYSKINHHNPPPAVRQFSPVQSPRSLKGEVFRLSPGEEKNNLTNSAPPVSTDQESEQPDLANRRAEINFGKQPRVGSSQRAFAPTFIREDPPSIFSQLRRMAAWATGSAFIVGGLTGAYFVTRQIAESSPNTQELIQPIQQTSNIRAAVNPVFVSPQDQLRIIEPEWSNLLPTAGSPSDATSLVDNNWKERPEPSKKKKPEWTPSRTWRDSTSTEKNTAEFRTSDRFSSPRPGGGDNTELNTAISEWISACETNDVKKQLSFYASTVAEYKSNKNVPREDVEFDKGRMLDSSNEVKVKASKPVISSDLMGKTASVLVSKSVLKKGEGKTEEGTQELRWQKTRSGWKIVSERELILAQ